RVPAVRSSDAVRADAARWGDHRMCPAVDSCAGWDVTDGVPRGSCDVAMLRYRSMEERAAHDEPPPDADESCADAENTEKSETLTLGKPRRARVRRFRLFVVAGPDANLRFVSKGGRALIGTHHGADLVLSDRTVSRFQCEITVEDDRAVLRDLGSR